MYEPLYEAVRQRREEILREVELDGIKRKLSRERRGGVGMVRVLLRGWKFERDAGDQLGVFRLSKGR